MLHFRGQAHAATAALPAWEQWLAQVRAELRAAKLAVAWGGTSLNLVRMRGRVRARTRNEASC